MWKTSWHSANLFCSVVSCAVIIKQLSTLPLQFTERKRVLRYYIPYEPLNYEAVKVHGLTVEEIILRRKNDKYAPYFKDDDYIQNLIDGVDFLICHNADFDESHLPVRIHAPFFCTMRSNICSVGRRRPDGTLKYPTLHETAICYGIPHMVDELHSADSDADLTSRVFESMVRLHYSKAQDKSNVRE